MQSPPLELVLDVVHLATRNLVRNVGDPDDDTISEIIRGVTNKLPYPDLSSALILGVAAYGFWHHIRRPKWLTA